MQVHRVSMTMCGMHSGKHPNVPKVLGDSRNGLDTYTVTMQSFLLIVILQSPMNHTTPSSLCTGSDGEEVVLWKVISDIQKSIRLLATLKKTEGPQERYIQEERWGPIGMPCKVFRGLRV